jgi:hypothetical protein
LIIGEGCLIHFLLPRLDDCILFDGVLNDTTPDDVAVVERRW